jgi:hypothetical protein
LAALKSGLDGDVSIRVAPLDQPTALRSALDGCAAVVACVGPFVRYGEPVVQAARTPAYPLLRPLIARLPAPRQDIEEITVEVEARSMDGKSRRAYSLVGLGAAYRVGPLEVPPS